MKVHYAPQYFMEPLHPITITVVGVGGNGTQVLNDLAKIHISLIELGHPGLDVTAIDDDKVDWPNIGRQKFSVSDLGNYKASVIVTRLNRFYGLSWNFIPEKFNTEKYKGSNIIISCVDNVKTRLEINKSYNGSRSEGVDFNKKFWFYTMILLTVIILTTVASAAEKSEWLNKNPCMIKVVITNTEINGVTTTTKEEKLECLIDLIKLMKIDKKIYQKEIDFCERIALKLGYQPKVIMELSAYIYNSKSIHTDRSILEDIVDKYYIVEA